VPANLTPSVSAAPTRHGFVERPGCRVCFEVTGAGPALVFAHGLGSNHLTWWQQVAHFSQRYTCVAFSHRGYPPSSAVGVPDPGEFAGDLAALIEHLQLEDVRLVGQSMGGFTCLEYLLAHPRHRVRALVLASTSGSICKAAIPLADPQRLAEWQRDAAAARADMQHRGISPPAGERMAREQPALHQLYRSIANASNAFDREELRRGLDALSLRPPDVLRNLAAPTLFVTGGDDTTFAPFLADALAPAIPDARVEHVADAGHSVYFERAPRFNRSVERFLAAVDRTESGSEP
jgi:pimeloyl-ACP methyl ester carboxylesterase